MLKKESIHIALDTSLSVLGDKQKELLTMCDLVIADLKFTTAELYSKFCKNDILGTVIDSLRYLKEKNIPVWIRIVIIPDINDTKEFVKDYYEIIKDFDNIKKIELKPFHTMGFEKYEKLKIQNPFIGKKAMEEDKLDVLKNYLITLIENK